MKPIWQLNAGGPGSPPEEHGDCFRACVCSILELGTGDLDSPSPELPFEEWDERWKVQLADLGLWMMGIEVSPEDDLWWCSPGYWIASVPSLNFGTDAEGEPIRHAVVMYGRALSHDPSTQQQYSRVRVPEDVLAARWLIPLDPAEQLSIESPVREGVAG